MDTPNDSFKERKNGKRTILGPLAIKHYVKRPERWGGGVKGGNL